MKEKVKAPELRFPGFTDDWEERKLKDVVEKQIKGKAQFEKLAPGDVEYLDTSRLNGGQAILTNGLKDVMLDDVLILWDGSKAGTVYHGFEGSLGSTLKAYRTSADSKFVYQYLKRYQDNIYNNYRTPNIPHVQKDFLDVFTISVPRSDEQAKIGSFFKQLDDTIALHQHKLDLLKEQKKGYLQKMFPKNGEKVPELRFAGFADDWEERKLEDVYNILSGFAFKMNDYTSDGVNIINGESINHGCVKSNNWNYLPNSFLEKYSNCILRTGDIVIGLNRPITNNELKIAQIPSYLNNSLLYQRAGKVEFLKNIDVNFTFQILNNEIYKFVLKESQGSDQPFISTTKLKKWSFLIPKNELEQQKIGSFFKQLDDTIALHQRKLDLLKEQKKGFLQKMFV